MKKLLTVIGTRPEAIKMCPLALELARRESLDSRLLAVYQHRELLTVALGDFGVTADITLELRRSTLSALASDILRGVEDVLKTESPDAVLVHGDTLTAASSALAAFFARIPIFHVEAGLRTYNVKAPYPEEFCRRLITLVADLHFAPTEAAKENLLREGVDENRIFVTGNTVTDALRLSLGDITPHDRGERTVLITCHRRESIGGEMYEYLSAARRVLEARGDTRAILPVHPNPEVKRLVEDAVGSSPYFKIIPATSMREFHRLMASATVILTDSGGVQEEACALGVPTLVLRSVTERPEGLEAGTLRLCTDSETLEYELTRLLGDEEYLASMRNVSNVFGDGYTSRRIADIIENEPYIFT